MGLMVGEVFGDGVMVGDVFGDAMGPVWTYLFVVGVVLLAFACQRIVFYPF